MKLRNKKTGKIVELDHFSMHYNRPEEWGVQPCSTWNHSLAELNEEWEDYKPAEPLIKDEKIRKAVRAWAGAMGVKTVKYDDYWQSFSRDNATICFRDNGDYYFKKLENGKEYTIAELCGEDETDDFTT